MAKRSTWPTNLINQGLAGVAVTALTFLVQINLLVPPLVAGTFSPGQEISAVVLLVATAVGSLVLAVWYARRALAYIRSTN